MTIRFKARIILTTYRNWCYLDNRKIRWFFLQTTQIHNFIICGYFYLSALKLFPARGEKSLRWNVKSLWLRIFVTVCVWNLSLTWSVRCRQHFAFPLSWHRLNVALKKFKARSRWYKKRSRKMLKSIWLKKASDFRLVAWRFQQKLSTNGISSFFPASLWTRLTISLIDLTSRFLCYELPWAFPPLQFRDFSWKRNEGAKEKLFHKSICF